MQPPPTRRPNLVFLMADQLGRNHVGYAGASRARTPHLDALSREGVDVANAVSTMPVCAAFRASLFTGKYPTTTGMVINELRMNPDHECIGYVLGAAGYRQGYIGKWHLWANELGNHTDPSNSYIPPGRHRLGFDGHWAAYNFHHDYYDTYYHTDSPEKIPYPEGAYEPDAQTDMAIEFMETAAGGDEPFSLFVSYGTPHDPWSNDNVPADYRRLFLEQDFPHPPNYEPENDPYADGWGRIDPARRDDLENWRRNYYAMTANLDHNVGRVVDTLSRLGIEDDTLLVFTSDHGEMFGAHGRRAKSIFYEEAARVPMLVRWPGALPAGRPTEACLGTVDIMPTLLGLMDLPVPADVEGMDLSAAMRGEDGPEPEAALLQNTGACAIWRDGFEWRAARDKRYTYATYRVDGTELLFDNLEDPYQMTDLSADPAHAAELTRLRDWMRSSMEGIEDGFRPSSYYRDHFTDGNRVILRGERG
ncbi:MAG: sulfatase-like hydrolase/transferase [Armatimonadia bacterium]|nr:sulfatase-like hydrolase/transferase [Armatimonadia bacterium]